MSLRSCLCLLMIVLTTSACQGEPDAGNRLTYLEEIDPYPVGLKFPKLITPQWVGEDGVEAVVVLAADDLNENTALYEAYLRPILDRLKQIDGRAGLSIMTCKANGADPRVQAWLAEGVNLDVHTLTHPCPLLQKDNLAAAQHEVHGGVDLLNGIRGNKPVAFRMPCCDSQNTPSPRFYAEIFNKTSPGRNFLTIDSSVFQLFTPDDPSLPRELVQDPDGRERFRKYIPFSSFTNYVENYPYPYVIGKLCWEFPCSVPSDWEAQHLQQPNNPKTVEDMKAAIDAVVMKQGVFNLVFHPHGWIKSEQVVELIDHVVAKHGKKVKFLNFREAQERLDKNLLGGHPLRASDGRDNGVRVLDVDNDGYMDVVIGNSKSQLTRIWEPSKKRWSLTKFPGSLVDDGPNGVPQQRGVFGRFDSDGRAAVIAAFHEHQPAAIQRFVGGGQAVDFVGASAPVDPSTLPAGWERDLQLSQGLEAISGRSTGLPQGLRLRDLNGDGRCEIILSNDADNLVLAWSPAQQQGGSTSAWKPLDFRLPPGAQVADREGGDGGLRFADLDEDGYDDLVFSHSPFHKKQADSPATIPDYGLSLFESMTKGWSRDVLKGQRGDVSALPLIAQAGMNQGMWIHSRHLWWQNEATAKLPNLVDRRAFNDLLQGVESKAKSPEASRRSIRVNPGFTVELVASEPLVEDPIAFDWGADGRLWVLEMGDYPLGRDGKGKAGGVVRTLEDKDGDGRYDKATLFLDGLAIPSGLLPWRNGVLIACAPDILYVEDRDGDGKADHREVLFTGFREGNPQHRLNGFELGLDGWVYGANGDSGGEIRSIKTGAIVSINGRDFRFRPDDGRFEAESGQTQYGRHRDDWGNWFGNSNPIWAWHYVLADSDLRRNPQFAVPDTRQILESDNKLYPLSRTLARFNEPHSANRVTSANSPTPYRDDLFGRHFESSLFASDPVHNLVHRMILEPDGATFLGKRGPDEAEREFLASADNWTRPTMLKTGPDGALWIADMYRAVIEHPEWIPDDWEAKLDLRAGSEQGRIYRVFPVEKRPRPITRLDRFDTVGLVAALDSPNGWQRDTAQRLLLHKGDRAAAGPLRDLAAKSSRPKTRLQALWTLQTLEELTVPAVIGALSDPHPQVRRNAIKAGSVLLKSAPELGEAMLRLTGDPDPQVRFQLALSLGDWSDPRAGRALATLIQRDPNDRWLRAAVLSSAAPHVGSIIAALFENAKDEAPSTAILDPLFALAATAKEREGLASLVETLSTPAGQGGQFAPWQFSALASLLDASVRARKPVAEADLKRFEKIREAARALAGDDKAGEEDRLAAVRLLGRDKESQSLDRPRLVGLLRPQVSGALQQAAVAALSRGDDPQVPTILIDGWKGHSPQLRTAILDTLLSRDPWTKILLFSLEDTCLPPAEIGPTHRRRLLSHRDAALKARAEAVFSRETSTRQEVIAAYQTATTLPGNAATGAALFKKVCATCHRVGQEGAEVGPDLAALTDKSPGALLVAILDPNRALEAKYANFTVQTTDGRVLTGLIASETATAVTLRRQEGKEDVLLRAEIDEIAASGQSLMPEGLEKDLKPQDVADLLAFLGAVGPPPKQVEGNRPERVTPGADGTIALRAETAELYGDTLTFEAKHKNLGYWGRPSDRAVWKFVSERPGRYRVWIDWACDNDSAGNSLLLELGSQRLEHPVTGTGDWDTYQSADIGEVTLTPGAHRLELHSAGPVKGALLDLRSVELRPVPDPAKPTTPGSCCNP
ncbi:PVC-type heme-binding CxxCH protein [Singulisphaera acidiphila]|uniref:Putative membrane-bound dehydrogenase n=1 Tax=Singulisphaera acidiphila (strain ATCC BAA-1392 / DSM 18658 / VKM B-2454 / MOB10) TaxID=886293 RepID=L0DKB6_SINAD|nr:PVC-type heme-binding CxxCH protein [Singulisphaera acidiphila]AGA29280.1 putative membrane-bound dehydrogenase [Singulisphaera acidiphila DSM 18658]